MTPPTPKVVEFFRQLGIDQAATDVYIYLLQHGEQPVLSISKGLNTGRTKLYPVLETLAAKHLIVTNQRHYGSSYRAAPVGTLRTLLQDQQLQLEALKQQRSGVTDWLNQYSHPSLNAQWHHQLDGKDGLQQAIWELTKTDGLIRILHRNPTQEYKNITQHFYKKVQSEFETKGIRRLSLGNGDIWYPDRTADTAPQFLQNRYLAPNQLIIDVDTFITNYTVTFVSQHDEQVECLVINNSQIAQWQQSVFDHLWASSEAL